MGVVYVILWYLYLWSGSDESVSNVMECVEYDVFGVAGVDKSYWVACIDYNIPKF
jgi:hypothetical protein